MSTGTDLLIGAVFVFVVAPLSLVLLCLDWRRIFGMPSYEEVAARRRYEVARAQISGIFAAAGARMDRRTGSGDPFKLGNGGRRW